MCRFFFAAVVTIILAQLNYIVATARLATACMLEGTHRQTGGADDGDIGVVFYLLLSAVNEPWRALNSQRGLRNDELSLREITVFLYRYTLCCAITTQDFILRKQQKFLMYGFLKAHDLLSRNYYYNYYCYYYQYY